MPLDRYEVYALGEREHNQVYYIGLSDDHDRRLRQHINAAVNPRSLWLQQLIVGQGRRPAVKVIGRYPTLEAAKAAEEEWIAIYRADGHPLTNALTARERRAAREAGTVPAAVPPAEAAAPPTPPPVLTRPPLPAHRTPVRAWVMGLAVFVLGTAVLAAGLFWAGTQRGTGPIDPAALAASLGSALPLPSVPAAPPALPVEQGAIVPSPTPQRLGSHSVQVQPNQTLADVAAQLEMTSADLATQLGRSEVYAGEEIVSDLVAADLGQGGGPTPSPTIDIYTGKGVDAPVAPVIETTVLASTGICPPGTARAGRPRDGRVVVPFVPGCAPDDAGARGPQEQAWVPGPADPGLATGGGPPAELPATGGGSGLLHGATDRLGAVADSAAGSLEAAAPPPVSYCPDGTVRDWVHRVQPPFVPGCAPLPSGPVHP